MTGFGNMLYKFLYKNPPMTKEEKKRRYTQFCEDLQKEKPNIIPDRLRKLYFNDSEIEILTKIFKKCFALDINKRYQNYDDIINDLNVLKYNNKFINIINKNTK